MSPLSEEGKILCNRTVKRLEPLERVGLFSFLDAQHCGPENFLKMIL